MYMWAYVSVVALSSYAFHSLYTTLHYTTYGKVCKVNDVCALNGSIHTLTQTHSQRWPNSYQYIILFLNRRNSFFCINFHFLTYKIKMFFHSSLNRKNKNIKNIHTDRFNIVRNFHKHTYTHAPSYNTHWFFYLLYNNHTYIVHFIISHTHIHDSLKNYFSFFMHLYFHSYQIWVCVFFL